MARRQQRQLALTHELVSLVDRKEPDPGPEGGRPEMSDPEFDRAARELLAQNAGNPFWVFAYGSLIWKPDFEHVDHLVCRAFGWRRSFCLDIRRWRGSPEQPGLMMALDRGGCCHGVAYLLPPGDHHAQMVRLLKREISYPENLAAIRWIDAHVQGRTLRALTFWAMPRTVSYYVSLPIDQQAVRIARAAGHVGSCAEYLHKTVVKLEEFGIHDSYLWRLQDLVAAEIRGMRGGDGRGFEPGSSARLVLNRGADDAIENDSIGVSDGPGLDSESSRRCAR